MIVSTERILTCLLAWQQTWLQVQHCPCSRFEPHFGILLHSNLAAPILHWSRTLHSHLYEPQFSFGRSQHNLDMENEKHTWLHIKRNMEHPTSYMMQQQTSLVIENVHVIAGFSVVEDFEKWYPLSVPVRRRSSPLAWLHCVVTFAQWTRKLVAWLLGCILANSLW